MTQSETLAQYFGLTYRVIKRQTNGLTHEDSLLQPPFRGNCLNWVLGHILASRQSILTYLGESPTLTEEEITRYSRDSEPVTGTQNALPLARLLHTLEESQERIMAGLQKVSSEALETPVGDETVGEKISLLHWHETYHVGQLELLRQLAGTNDKVI